MTKKPQNAFPELPKIPSIAGVRISGVVAGLKDNGKHDLFVAELVRGSTIAGTFTRSKCPGMPVEGSKRQLAVGKAGERAERDLLGIAIGGIQVAEAGETLPDFDAKAVIKHLKAGQVHFTINIGIGRGKARVWSAL